ncbi:MAG: DMT family transporter [Clostridiales bacterium]|nr:DMT family transporter [Clostridiales bacterium]
MNVNIKLNNKTKGIILIVCSAFFFAVMNLFVRLSGDLPSMQKSFFRNFVALFFSLGVVIKNRTSFASVKGNEKYIFYRAFFGTIGLVSNYYAIDHMILTDASMLNKLSPFFAVVFSALFLKEKVKPWQVLAVAGAFIGSLFIIKPSMQIDIVFPYIIGFIGGMGAGAAYTAVRFLGGRGVPGGIIVFFFSLFSCVVCLPFAIACYEPMAPIQLILLLLAGLSATGGQFCITYAYTFAPAREISVYDYSQIIFSAILGFFVLSQTPDIYSFLGYLIICGMGVLNFIFTKKHHEKQEQTLKEEKNLK